MGVRLIRKKAKAALGKSNLPGVDYTVNPYTGCSHGCIYCYARLYCQREIGENWGSVVVVRDNIAEVLERELRGRAGRVVLSTLTDAYQHVEREVELTKKILQILLRNNFRVGIQTKSDLVLRDLSLLAENAEKVDVGFTITTLDDSFAKIIEPYAPPPSKRVKALEKLSGEGIKTWIFLGPIIPGVEDFAEIVEVAAATSSKLFYDKFRVKDFMRSGFVAVLAERAKNADWKKIFQQLEENCKRAGVEVKFAFA